MTQPNQPKRREHLFTLRLWRENGGEGQREWRGRLYATETGRVRYFHDWSSLLPLLLAMLREAEEADQNRPSA